jgi:hypothetical protein
VATPAGRSRQLRPLSVAAVRPSTIGLVGGGGALRLHAAEGETATLYAA